MKALSLFAFLSLLFVGILSPLSAGGRVDVQVGPADPYYYDDGVVWIGPGVYYGVWFDNEYQFYAWRRYNRRYYRHHNRYYHDNHYYRNNGQHHGGHHGGQGHK